MNAVKDVKHVEGTMASLVVFEGGEVMVAIGRFGIKEFKGLEAEKRAIAFARKEASTDRTMIIRAMIQMEERLKKGGVIDGEVEDNGDVDS